MPLRRAIFSLAAWTVFLWVSRLRNVLEDDSLTSAGTAWRIGVGVVFVAMAVWVALAWRRREVAPGQLRLALHVLVNWTIGFWLVRGIGIVLDDHDLGFTLVHTALMIVSISLAVWARPRPVSVST